MVAGDGGKALGESVAHHHIDADGMHELLDMLRHRGPCRGEEMGILQSQLLADKGEDGLVQHLVLQVKTHRWTTALREVVDVVAASYLQGMLEELALDG